MSQETCAHPGADRSRQKRKSELGENIDCLVNDRLEDEGGIRAKVWLVAQKGKPDLLQQVV